MAKPEYQQEFNNIIQSIKEGTYKSEALTFYDAELTDEDAAELCEAIHVATEAGKCNITRLDLSGNQFTTVNFERLVQLKELDLSENKLISFDSRGLTQLKKLVLYKNNLTTINNIERLTQLEKLELSSNNFETIDVKGLAQLKELDLAWNQLITINNIKELIQLEKLDISDNKLTALDDIKGLAQLKELNLARNNLETINIERLIQLEELDLTSNALKAINVKGLTQLKKLKLYNNQITNINVEGLVQLEKLEISKNKLTTINIEELAQLKELYLAKNKFTFLTRTKLYNFLSSNLLGDLYSNITKPTLEKQTKVNNEFNEKVDWTIQQYLNGKELDAIETELKSNLKKEGEDLLLTPEDSIYIMSEINQFNQCASDDTLLFFFPSNIKENIIQYMCLDSQNESEDKNENASDSPAEKDPISSIGSIKP